MHWMVRGIVFFAVVGLLQGCATHLYSETRDKQGQDFKAAYAKVDVDSQVATARKNYAAILEEQMKFEDDSWAFYRTRLADHMLANWNVGQLKGYINDSMTAIAENGSSVLAALANAEFQRGEIDKEARTMATLGYRWPGCAAILGDRLAIEQDHIRKTLDTRADGVLNSLKAQSDSCNVLGAALLQAKASKGELADAQAALLQEQQAQASDQSDLTDAQAQLQAAAKVYDEAQSRLAPGTASEDAFKKADDELRKAMAKLANLQSSVGKEFIAQDRLDKVNEFLTTYEDVAAGKGAPAGSSKLAIALGLYPDLHAKEQAALADLQRPNLVPLLQQKMLEQAKLDAAQRDVGRRKDILKWRQTYVDVLMDRLITLNTARQAGAKLGEFKVSDSMPLGAALAPITNEQRDAAKPKERAELELTVRGKQELWRMAALVLHSEGALRADAGKARYQITALSYEESMSYAESGFQQWKALLDPSVDLAGQYAASGLKAKDIQDLLNTLALLWIAVGVQR